MDLENMVLKIFPIHPLLLVKDPESFLMVAKSEVLLNSHSSELFKFYTMFVHGNSPERNVDKCNI
uniref:Uncharacterized protein n=1 Tax=Megaselia scalaris TaxID=36166 RepID=T1GW32_MEGSC